MPVHGLSQHPGEIDNRKFGAKLSRGNARDVQKRRRSLDVFAYQASQALQRDDDGFGTLTFRAPTDRHYMFDIPEDRRHRIAQLVCGDRYERVTRVHRPRQLRDKTRVLASRRCTVAEAGGIVAQLKNFGGQVCFAFHHISVSMKSPFRQLAFWPQGPRVAIDRLKMTRAGDWVISGSKRIATRHWFYRRLPSPSGVPLFDEPVDAAKRYPLRYT